MVPYSILQKARQQTSLPLGWQALAGVLVTQWGPRPPLKSCTETMKVITLGGPCPWWVAAAGSWEGKWLAPGSNHICILHLLMMKPTLSADHFT